MRILRLYQINKVFLQHGLDELIPEKWLPWYAKLGRFGFFWLRNKHKDKSQGTRIRLALQSLGPVFIKFGQMLSTRKDLLSQDIANELAILQDQVAPFDSEVAQQIIRHALGVSDLNEVFSEFDATPLASASIAQVHAAKLIGHSEEVIVKVIRPNIGSAIHADIQLMRTFANALQKLLPDGKRLRPVEVVAEYEKTIVGELDLLNEAANGIQFKRNFENSDALYVPHIYSDYCHANVMVMERIYGTPISDVATLEARGTNMKKLAERGVEVFFTQVFRDSFFHADMHPGNIFVALDNPDDPQYITIDYGIVGTLNSEDKRYLAENFIAFFNRNYRKVAELHVDSGWVPSTTSIDEFEASIRRVCEPIFQKPLAEIEFSNVLLQLFNTARRFNMIIQPQLVLLQKTLLYIEGLGRQLYPQLDLWQTAKPFLENWMREQIGVKAMYNKVSANLPFWSEKLPEIPDLLYDSMRQIRRYPEQQKLQFEKQQWHVKQQQRRLVFTIIGATLLVVSSVMPIYIYQWWVPAGVATAGIVSWLIAWRCRVAE
ncbi:MAG: ubiquinone biosynthesis regulatory protein kinase UbiB [Alteromonadaceae bacterium]|uniref:ubiquinone biosynthesis regulatory protein kinase UbiB n=1 Tax=Paraglaciecola chathamensis TaxID=368405 RepID=UPI000C3CA136|nr:ubiquinone biosynthesis regulatory protein kinase UbiB [Paraglaciecola agarilytica]MBN27463.1 ubiquinone biosynthesis regulatory protein kinase UbiB [Alteromonadaceae bacterium]